MAEYIDKEVAIRKTEVFCDVFATKWTDEKVVAWIINLPTIDAVPVVHGRWEYHDCVCTGEGLIAVYACSACQGCIDEDAFDLYAHNYCPNCGARMDGE